MPITVREAYLQGREHLAASGLPEAAIEAEMLLRHTLQWDRARLYTCWEVSLPGVAWDGYRRLLDERATGRPVHYIVGQREFLGLTFAVDERVMIPRPETEVLVEFVAEWLRGREPPRSLRSLGAERGNAPFDALRSLRALDSPEPAAEGHERAAKRRVEWERDVIVDVGTGSGCIAVSLARQLPSAVVYATDVSADALAVARTNAVRHSAGGRIVFLEGDLLGPMPPSCAGRVAAVVSNPPYVPASLRDTLAREISGFEPPLAVFVDGDGIAMHRRLIADAPRWLAISGLLAMEVGSGQAEAVLEAMRRDGRYAGIIALPDYGGIPRVVAGVRQA